MKGSTGFIDAKCRDSYLYFLDQGKESNETQIIVYDLYEGIKDEVHDLLVLATYDSSSL